VSPSPPSAVRQDPAHDPPEPSRWCQAHVRSNPEGNAVVAVVLSTMTDEGYPEPARERARQALEEALTSALQVSNQKEPATRVRFDFQVAADYLLAEVEGWSGLEEGRLAAVAHGPHIPLELQAAGEEPPARSRSYTWLRCDKRTGRLHVCKYLTLA
jgi:hypothetical protein